MRCVLLIKHLIATVLKSVYLIFWKFQRVLEKQEGNVPLNNILWNNSFVGIKIGWVMVLNLY